MNVLSPDIPDSFPARDIFGRPAVQLFIGVSCGVLLASMIGYRFGGLLWASSLVSAAAAWLCGPTRWLIGSRTMLLVAVVLGAASWTALRVSHGPDGSLAGVLNDQPTLLTLEGVVLDQPRTAEGSSGALAEASRYAPASVRFLFAAYRVRGAGGDWAEATGKLYTTISASDEVEFQAGDRIRLMGMASALRQSGNPGSHDPRPSAMQRGIVGSIRVDGAQLVTVAEPAGAVSGLIQRRRAQALDRIESAGERSGRESASALLSALLLGERDARAIKPLEDAFTRTGVGHFLAISGLHVGMVLVGLALVVRLTGDRPRLEMAVIIVAAVLMLAFIPARPPVLRAILIALAMLLAQASGRAYDRLSVLALVATALLIVRPIDLFNPGYQLTFLVVAGLIVCVGPLRLQLFGERERTDELRGWQHASVWLKDGAAVSICASAVSTPLIALHFGVFSALAAPLSLLLMPLVALVLGTGYLALVIGALVPSAFDGALEVALEPAVWLASSVRRFDALPGVAVYLPSVSWPLVVAAVAIVVWWMFPSYTSERRRRAATGMLLLALLGNALLGPLLPRSQALRLDMLDVGDGTAILLRSGREAVLYDCGSRWLGIGEREIPRAIRALGSAPVRTVIVSHPDIDHFSGLIDAARPLGVRRVVVPELFLVQAEQHPEGAPALLVRRLREMGIAIETAHRGDSVPLGRTSLEILHPGPDDSFRRDNDGSLVVRIRPTGPDGPVIVLLGDIEREAMSLLEAREPGLVGDVIEVPHHGSARSFAYPFVEMLDPAVLLQSTGPSRLLDERWDAIREGRDWRTTASDGAITVIIDREGAIRVRSRRGSG